MGQNDSKWLKKGKKRKLRIIGQIRAFDNDWIERYIYRAAG